MDIIAAIAEELQIKKGQVEAAVKLIDEGNTIPFIARYRKEATGSLNDEVVGERQVTEQIYECNSEKNAHAKSISSVQVLS
jgi:protein Tex